jgi:hypothetical protein
MLLCYHIYKILKNELDKIEVYGGKNQLLHLNLLEIVILTFILIFFQYFLWFVSSERAVQRSEMEFPTSRMCWFASALCPPRRRKQ